MNIITSPRVFLTGYQVVNEKELNLYLDDIGAVHWNTDAADGASKIIEAGGRVCYQSFAKPRPGGHEAYVGNILSSAHGSVLEHGVFTFIVRGVSRSLSHELVRHRVGMSPSQLSQRYVDESVAEYVCPLLVDEDQVTREVWQDAVEYAHNSYLHLVDRLTARLTAKYPDWDKTTLRKAARGAARSVLPNATETHLQITINVRALRWFIEQRCNEFADEEIRRLAYALWERAFSHSPSLFDDYEPYSLADGTKGLKTPYRKV